MRTGISRRKRSQECAGETVIACITLRREYGAVCWAWVVPCVPTSIMRRSWPRTNARSFRAISCHVPEGFSTATGSSRVSREGKGHPPWSCQHRLASYWASAPAKRRTQAAASQAAACAGVTGREAGYCRAGRLGRRRAPTMSVRASARPSTNAMPSCGQAIVEPESDASTEVPIAVPRANAPGRSYASR